MGVARRGCDVGVLSWVVAEIAPPRSRNESVIERGIREGWITPAKRGPDWPPKGGPVPGLTLEKILADLDEARKDPWC